MKPVAIVGAGITGLTAGFYLQQKGIPVVIYEAGRRTGGMVQSTSRDGFLVELGPNTIMTNSVAVPDLVRDLDLVSRRQLPSDSATTRYIVRNGRPVRVPSSLPGALGTSLLSLTGKLRVLAEPFIAKGHYTDESLAAFVRRRLGPEFLDYLIDPFVAGVYAGDPEQLSVTHALPRMAALENSYGSLVKGAVLGARERRERNAPIQGEPRMFSFNAGLGVLTDGLTARLDGAIRLNSPVRSIRRDGDDAWAVHTAAGSQSYSSLLLCTPAHRFPEIAPEFQDFAQVYYSPIARLAFGFRRSQIAHPLDGFGVLVPRRERRSILGVLFSSSMFPNRAPADHVLLTVFAGGARDAQLMHQTSGQIARLALDDLRSLLGITGTPAFEDVLTIERSIPQYNVGYGAVKDLITRLEARSPGLFFAGSFATGISVSDCIAGGAAAAQRIAAHATAASRQEVLHA